MGDNLVFEENVYYDQTETPDIFNVTVVENVSAERCHMKGIYELHISTENFSIVDKTTNKRLYTWPFRHVRRYGRSSTNFQFEAGRKCSSGEGLFSLLTTGSDSEKIFQLIQTRFNFMKERDKKFRSGSIDEQSAAGSPTGNPPTLAARQYENNSVPTPAPKLFPQPIPKVNSRNSIKPPIKAKPKSFKAPNALPKTSGPTAGASNASEINSFIGKNKDLFTPADQNEENNYSIVGQTSGAPEPAQYSAVYAQSKVQSYSVEDDTYDEVNM